MTALWLVICIFLIAVGAAAILLIAPTRKHVNNIEHLYLGEKRPMSNFRHDEDPGKGWQPEDVMEDVDGNSIAASISAMASVSAHPTKPIMRVRVDITIPLGAFNEFTPDGELPNAILEFSHNWWAAEVAKREGTCDLITPKDPVRGYMTLADATRAMNKLHNPKNKDVN